MRLLQEKEFQQLKECEKLLRVALDFKQLGLMRLDRYSTRYLEITPEEWLKRSKEALKDAPA